MEGTCSILAEVLISYIRMIFSYHFSAMFNYYSKNSLQYLFKASSVITPLFYEASRQAGVGST